MVSVRSTPFANQDGGRVFNASGVIAVSSSRFAFIDTRDARALFELNLNPDGTQHGPIVRRPFVGLPAGALSDPEGIARIDTDGATDLIVASSLGVRGLDPSGKIIADGERQIS